MESPTVDISVVVPVYRSERSVAPLVERLVNALDQLGRIHEIVLVDDASPDGTWRALEEAQRRHGPRIVLIQLARNAGQHNTLMCGFRHARGRLVVTIDDDLQHPPEEIGKLVAKLEADDLDLVYGSYRTKRHNLFRKVVSIPIGLYHLHVFGTQIPPTSFRVLRRELVETILHYRGSFTVVDGLAHWATDRIGRVMIDHAPRALGRSTHSFSKLMLLAFNIFTNFSLTPLRFLFGAGALFILFGLFLAAIGVGLVEGRAAETRWLILASIFFVGGVQLLALGLVGEYLGRVHLNLNQKPQYVVRRVERLAADPHHATSEIAREALEL